MRMAWFGKIVCPVVFLAALPLRAISLSDGETATPGATDYEITGSVFFGAGEYSGRITGTGTAIIEAGGNATPCVFSNADNTYSGGTIISNAAWKVLANGTMGSGKITIAMVESRFLIEGTTTVVANEVELLKSEYYINRDLDTAHVQMPLWQEVEFTGGICARSTLFIRPDRKDTNTGLGGRTVYDCEVRCCANDDGSGKQSFYPWGYGTHVFKENVLCSWIYMGENSSENGFYEFYSSSNSISAMQVRGGKLSFFANDIAPLCGVRFRYAGTDDGRGVINLNGYDQHFAFISDRDPQASALNPNRKSFTSETPARITMTGRGMAQTSNDYKEFMPNAEWKLEGAVSFCLDATPFPDFTLGFSKATHTTTGDLIVSNGVINVNNGASFPKVNAIVVAEGGKLNVNSGTLGAFAACTRLVVDGAVTFTEDSALAFSQNALTIELGANGRLTLPSSQTLTVNALVVDGESLPKGIYRQEVAQLLGGTLNVVPPVDESEATWTGAGSDTAITTAANWSTAPETPDLDSGSVLATFAAGGSAATLATDIALRGIVFGGVSSFSILGEGRKIGVKGAGVTVGGAADGEAHDWRVGPRVEYTEDTDQVLAVPEGHTLDFAGGVEQSHVLVNTKRGRGALKVGGSTYVAGSYRILEGAAEFSGTAQVANLLYVSNAVLTVKGRISTLGAGIPDSRVSSWTEGVATYGVNVIARKTPDGQGACSALRLDGAIFDAPFKISGPSCDIPPPVQTNWFTIAENSENAFNGSAILHSPVGWICCGPGSRTTFNSRLFVQGETRFFNPDPSRPAVINFAAENRTFDGASGGGPHFMSGLIVNLSGTNNYLRVDSGGQRYYYTLALDRDRTRVNFLNDYFFRVGSIGSWGGDVRIDLGATKQRLWRFTGQYSSGVLTGTEGSELEIGDYGSFERNYHVEGAVSLRMRSQDSDYNGTITQTGAFTNNVAVASTGNVTVDSGTMRFDENGTWANAGVVTVNGGRLELANNQAFGRTTKVVLTGGKLSLDYDAAEVPLKVGELWVGPDAEHLKRMPGGIYSAAGVPAEGAAAAPFFEGTGRLTVYGGGLLLIFR